MTLTPINNLRKLPDGWDLRRLKFVVDRFYSGGTPSTNNPDYWNGDFPWVSSKDMKSDEIVDTEDHITDLALEHSNLRLLPPGQLLLVVRSGILRHTIPVAINSVPVAVNQDIKALSLSEAVLPNFVQYIIKGMEGVWLSRWRKQGTTVESLEYDFYANDFLPIPSLAVQAQLVEYLEKRCHEIDDLIAKKRGLLKVLAEKRSALITRAVTKGLDPNAAMKPSGIDWLGDIPAHWEPRRFRFLISEPFRYGANEPAELQDPDFPRYIRITDVQEDGSLRSDTFRSLPPEVAEPYILQEGDILLARSGATVGKSFKYENSWGVAAYAGYLIRARPSVDVLPDYVRYFLHSSSYWQWVEGSFIQSTIQNISAEKYANLWLPVPSVDEQAEIVAKIKGSISDIDESAELVQRAIAKLTEYRSAIITKAVTGELKVA